MRAQLTRLHDAVALPNVTIQVLPFASGDLGVSLEGGFTILGFLEAADPDVVFVEGATTDTFLEHIEAIQRYSMLFERLAAQALSPTDSVAFFADSVMFFEQAVKKQPLSVFISYSHRDKPIAQALAAGLTDVGVRTWVDEGELRIGDSLIERISQAIHEVEFVVALVSKHSVVSKWCQRELSWAMSGELQKKGVRVLPLRVGEVTMPAALVDVRHLQVDADDIGAAVSRLVADVSSHYRERYGRSPDLQEPGESQARPIASSYLSDE
jgi:TIR domain/Domain of unknown function (DUF5753)